MELIFASLCSEKPCSHLEGVFVTTCAVQSPYKENRSTETGDYLLLRKKMNEIVRAANSTREVAFENNQVCDNLQ